MPVAADANGRPSIPGTIPSIHGSLNPDAGQVAMKRKMLPGKKAA
jgi:hypothetical protein